jgi:TDG/mug DNA glycosylase family protein
MSVVTSFQPIADNSAQVLVLGSMPGVLSLKAGQYYAHPRNAFWPIMASLYDFSLASSYESRVQSLKDSHIAVWDVLHSCVRVGSLDSAIVNGSRIANDFRSFFKHHPNITLIAFNGSEAEKSFKTYVLRELDLREVGIGDVTFVRLPSSSPAHTKSLEQKIEAWKRALNLIKTEVHVEVCEQREQTN